MDKQNYLYGIIGLLAGLIIGYIGAEAINRGAPAIGAAATAGRNAELPDNHPNTANSGGGPQADVMAAIELAQKEPANFEAQMKAAARYNQIGRSEDALKFYERAAKIKPGDLDLLTMLGNTHFNMQRYADAETWYQAALKAAPNNPTLWLDLGASYYLRQPRELDKAINAYRSALKADPRHEKSLQSLTRALLDKGDKAGARDSLTRLEQVNPKNESIAPFRAELN
jgi:tetratricopeptide (TPR) repeat protein